MALKGVDDRYPPQKKSFMMLHYMYEHYIDKFEWFARADDDVFIRTDKLEKFLRSVDSSKPQFIGQAGRGNSEEFGLLSLEFDENFCMGGPGVIMSRETLRRGLILNVAHKTVFVKIYYRFSCSSHSNLPQKPLQYPRRRGGGTMRSKVRGNTVYMELRGNTFLKTIPIPQH